MAAFYSNIAAQIVVFVKVKACINITILTCNAMLDVSFIPPSKRVSHSDGFCIAFQQIGKNILRNKLVNNIK